MPNELPTDYKQKGETRKKIKNIEKFLKFTALIS